MEATVAALLLVTASVVFACVVIGYAINIAQATMDSDDFAQVSPLQDYIYSVLNQTNNALDSSIGSTPIPQEP
jgi:hypothetical protein